MAQMPIGKSHEQPELSAGDRLTPRRLPIGNITAFRCPAAGRLLVNGYE